MEKPSQEQQLDQKMKQEGQNTKNEKLTTSEITGDDKQKSTAGAKPIIFKEDNTSAEGFEKDMGKFVENVRELTPYTVNGLSLVSEFTIAVRIEMEQQGFSLFRRANEAKES